MKALILLMISVFLSQTALAEHKAMKCSNSDGTVFWEYGHSEDNLIHLKYSHFIEGTLTLTLDQVLINHEKKILIQEKMYRECGHTTLVRVFASNVTIAAHDKNPLILQSLFPENKIETHVICTFQMSEITSCQAEN